MAVFNVENRTVFCQDNLKIMQGINSKTIDLIYLDPPFNKNRKFTAPMNSRAEGQAFSDMFRQQDVEKERDWLDKIRQEHFHLHSFLKMWKRIGKGYINYDYYYLCYMSARLIEMHRILKPTGSIYLHCDPMMSHYLKIVMDNIFGRENFLNEIVWSYRTGGVSKKWFGRKHDIILFYAKEIGRHKFNLQKEKAYTKAKSRKAGVINYGAGEAEFFEDDRGVYNNVIMRDVWELSVISSTSKERTGWSTQKPNKLLKRIITASTKKSDVVLDPFCGCSTACVVAEMLGRQWIGIDKDPQVHKVVIDRLTKEVQGAVEGKAKGDLHKYWDKEVIKSNRPPERAKNDGGNVQEKYVYIFSNDLYISKNFYKVGVSENWKNRLNDFQTSDPLRSFKKEYVTPAPIANFKNVEKKILEKFENVDGEWVRCDDVNEIIAEIERLAETDNNDKLL